MDLAAEQAVDVGDRAGRVEAEGGGLWFAAGMGHDRRAHRSKMRWVSDGMLPSRRAVFPWCHGTIGES